MTSVTWLVFRAGCR